MGEPTLEQRFADAMGQLLGPNFPTQIGVAVSGGGDSMAMLALAHHWARHWGVSLWIVTVDHGLRAASAEEAQMVADEAALLGHKHTILKWHWDGQGNVQARAREARLALINRWRGLLEHVLVAHTSDDVAETFLMRLSRQAGVEGLAEMARSRRVKLPPEAPLAAHEYSGDQPPQDRPWNGTRVRPGQFTLHRPCLEMSREELRHYARTLKVRWVEDPSNDDPAFARVKMRQFLPQLEEAGLGRAVLVRAAQHMARAAEALRLRAAQRFEAIGREGRVGASPTGELLFERTGFEATDRETQLRLLSYACAYVSSQTYRPREAPLEALLDRLLGGGAGTLHGCDIRMERHQLRVFREFQAVAQTRLTIEPGGWVQLWDSRFQISGMPSPDPATGPVRTLRALGDDGWTQIRERRDDAPPFYAARALPSLWEGERLIACPALGHGTAHQRLWPMGQEMYGFRRFLLSH